MRISKEIQGKLQCPHTKSKLYRESDYMISEVNPSIRYPIVGDVPVLIYDDKSLFSVADFIEKKSTTFNLNQGGILRTIAGWIPNISANIKAEQNYNELASVLRKGSKILVIGGSIQGEGMDAIYSDSSFEIIGSDVSFGPYTKIICDAHDIPFEDESFDCVIIQAVLEHVLDPHLCVNEVFRVLNSSGVVYAETPFMQQVHLKEYDFTRFTHLGHRRLFNHFDEIHSGPTCGPAMAFAWAYTYFLRSFVTSYYMTQILTKFAHLTSFWLKYFDYYLIDKPGSYDAASGYYFFGRKSTSCLSDKELIKQFQGIK